MRITRVKEGFAVKDTDGDIWVVKEWSAHLKKWVARRARDNNPSHFTTEALEEMDAVDQEIKIYSQSDALIGKVIRVETANGSVRGPCTAVQRRSFPISWPDGEDVRCDIITHFIVDGERIDACEIRKVEIG